MKLVFSVKHSEVLTNSPQGTRLCNLLITTYIRVSTWDMMTMPVVYSDTFFQEVR